MRTNKSMHATQEIWNIISEIPPLNMPIACEDTDLQRDKCQAKGGLRIDKSTTRAAFLFIGEP